MAEDARGSCRGDQVAGGAGLGSHRGGAWAAAAAPGIRLGGEVGGGGDGAEEGAGDSLRRRRRGRRRRAAGYGDDRPCGVAGTLSTGC